MNDDIVEFYIGEFTLARRKDGGRPWLYGPLGDGMEMNQATEEKLAELLAEFFSENM